MEFRAKKVIMVPFWTFTLSKLVHKKCKFCKEPETKETYRHFFFDCRIVNQLWKEIQQYYLIPRDNLTYRNIILNDCATNRQSSSNLIVLVTKQTLYRCKCANVEPNKNMVINEIKFIKKIEENNVWTKMQKQAFYNRWYKMY